MNLISKLTLSLLLFFLLSCEDKLELQNITEEVEYKLIEGTSYKVINVSATTDICTTFNSLEDNTLLNLEDGIYDIYCDILIQQKQNIIIQGNGAIFKYFDDNRFSLDLCINISIRDLNIDNNNTKANYDATPAINYGRIQLFSSTEIHLDNVNLNKQQILGSNQGIVHQIYLRETKNSTISNCKIETSDGELISLLGSTSCTVRNNLLIEGWSGVGTAGIDNDGSLIFGYDNKIIGNTVVNSMTAFLTINDRNALIEDNIIYNDDESIKHGPGIRFGHNQGEHKSASNAICRNNIIKNLKFPRANYYSVGIKVNYTQNEDSNQQFTDLIIEGNKILDCTGGISITNQEGQYSLIRDNEIQVTTDYAITIFSSISSTQHNCSVFNNTLSGGKGVIKISNSSLDLFNNSILHFLRALMIKLFILF